MGVALLGAIMALILVFPATKEMVVVLPSADGHVGMVVVERGDERFILNEPYASTRLTTTGEVKLEKLEEPEVAASSERPTEPQSPFERAAAVLPGFQGAVAALPERPALFYLYFITGTDTLTDASKLEFERMLEELRKRQAPDIVVIGHTDRVGVPEANDELSLQRAERMKADLVEQGIAPPERIRAAGRGEREPVVPTEDGVDEPLNRRVEINVR